MKIALFGGTFDPVHTGHLMAARAAAERFRLDQILFIPTGHPPHKHRNRLTPFPHRYAMVTLACTEDRRFFPSLLESPTAKDRPHYSIVTVRGVKDHLGARAELYFLVGADAFLDLPHWREYRSLLDLVNFIVVSRPGFENADVLRVVPPGLTPTRSTRPETDRIPLRRTTVYILRGVEAPVASRDIREAIRDGRRATGLVPLPVEQYILKAGLYRAGQRWRYDRR